MKAGYVSIIGKPNTGKSTLLNSILGQKLSAVTHKAQTTRSRILGIYMDSDSQIIFYDTPGIIDSRNRLEELMVKDIKQSVSDADILLMMVDDKNYAFKPDIFRSAKPSAIVLNKIDRMSELKLNEISDYLRNEYPEIPLLCISAMEKTNIESLLAFIKERLPYDHAFYPEDIITDKPEKFFVAEFIREKLFELYGAEIPYSCGIVLEEFKERDKGKTYIKAVIYVERDSQKAIMIGSRGSKIKQLGSEARMAVELFLDREIYLEIHVKVRKNWKDNTLLLSRMWGE